MQSLSRTIDVAFCIDDGYVSQLAVALHSILSSLDGASCLRAHIVGPLSADHVTRLQSMTGERFVPMFYSEVPAYEHLHISASFQSRLSKATYYRLALPTLLPQLSRVLYLDADIVALSDITPLWDIALGSSSTAVVEDYYLMQQGRQNMLQLQGGSYFNAGVMLLDLDIWRDQALSSRVAAAIAANPDWEYNDQDGLNVVLDGQCIYLDPKWNVTTTRLQAGGASPVIVHFTGQEKPWHYSCEHPYRDAYLAILQRTPWSDAPWTHFLDHEDRRILAELDARFADGCSIAIYGCGARGRRIAMYLQANEPAYDLRFMVDRTPRQPLGDIPVYTAFPDEDVDTVLIASVPYRDEIISRLPAWLVAENRFI